MKEHVRISKPKKQTHKQDWDGTLATKLNYLHTTTHRHS